MPTHYLSKTLTCIAAFAVIIGLDYVTGYEVTSFPLYLLPIMLAFFYFGKAGGYAAVGVATVFWFLNDVFTGHAYRLEVIRYWNAGARLLIYGLFVYRLSLYAKTLDSHRRRVEQLRALIPICHSCGRVLCPDHKWRPASEAFSSTSRTFFECGECPDRPEKTN